MYRGLIQNFQNQLVMLTERGVKTIKEKERERVSSQNVLSSLQVQLQNAMKSNESAQKSLGFFGQRKLSETEDLLAENAELKERLEEHRLTIRELNANYNSLLEEKNKELSEVKSEVFALRSQRKTLALELVKTREALDKAENEIAKMRDCLFSINKLLIQ